MSLIEVKSSNMQKFDSNIWDMIEPILNPYLSAYDVSVLQLTHKYFRHYMREYYYAYIKINSITDTTAERIEFSRNVIIASMYICVLSSQYHRCRLFKYIIKDTFDNYIAYMHIKSVRKLRDELCFSSFDPEFYNEDDINQLIMFVNRYCPRLWKVNGIDEYQLFIRIGVFPSKLNLSNAIKILRNVRIEHMSIELIRKLNDIIPLRYTIYIC